MDVRVLDDDSFDVEHPTVLEMEHNGTSTVMTWGVMAS